MSDYEVGLWAGAAWVFIMLLGVGVAAMVYMRWTRGEIQARTVLWISVPLCGISGALASLASDFIIFETFDTGAVGRALFMGATGSVVFLVVLLGWVDSIWNRGRMRAELLGKRSSESR